MLSKSWQYRGGDTDLAKKFERAHERQSNEFNAEEIVTTFMLLGTHPSKLSVTGATLGAVYDMLESVALPANARIVHKNTCGCNNGYCDQPVGYTIRDMPTPITYGAIFSEMGDRSETDLLSRGFYFEHPDSVYLYAGVVSKQAQIRPGGCGSAQEDARLQLDPSLLYISLGYGR